MKSFFFVSACVFIGILQAAPSKATTVEPMVLELSSGANGRSSQIVVHNDSAKDMPVELQVYRVEISEIGDQTQTRAQGDFAIFPGQRFIPPHGSQVFKIQWVGPLLEKSRTYNISVNQLPVKMPKDRTGVQVVMNFAVAANVAPPSGTATLDFVASSVETDQKKRHVPAIIVANHGNIHSKLRDATITLKNGSWSKVLTPGDIAQIIGIGVVQPGKRRKFRLPIELPASITQFSVDIAYSKTSM